jgi:hypothetical protein
MANRYRSLIFAAAVVLIGATWPGSSAEASVANGGFDGSAVGWKTIRTTPAGCETPYRSIVVAGDSSTSSALLGDSRAESSPGCDPSYIFQDFDCGSGEPGFCTVSFDASLWLVAGERAAVVLLAEGGADVVAREIPGARGGRTGRYAVSLRGGGRVRIVFAVWNSPGPQRGTRSLLQIDNVESFVTREDITSETLAPLHLASVPFDPAPGGIDGHLLQQIDTVPDCNENGIPDSFEISQGIAADKDGDGTPDDCVRKERRIDWVLLGMGIVILIVSLVRHARKRRARYL